VWHGICRYSIHQGEKLQDGQRSGPVDSGRCRSANGKGYPREQLGVSLDRRRASSCAGYTERVIHAPIFFRGHATHVEVRPCGDIDCRNDPHAEKNMLPDRVPRRRALGDFMRMIRPGSRLAQPCGLIEAWCAAIAGIVRNLLRSVASGPKLAVTDCQQVRPSLHSPRS
jgi:hypothetical protein